MGQQLAHTYWAIELEIIFVPSILTVRYAFFIQQQWRRLNLLSLKHRPRRLAGWLNVADVCCLQLQLGRSFDYWVEIIMRANMYSNRTGLLAGLNHMVDDRDKIIMILNSLDMENCN